MVSSSVSLKYRQCRLAGSLECQAEFAVEKQAAPGAPCSVGVRLMVVSDILKISLGLGGVLYNSTSQPVASSLHRVWPKTSQKTQIFTL